MIVTFQISEYRRGHWYVPRRISWRDEEQGMYSLFWIHQVLTILACYPVFLTNKQESGIDDPPLKFFSLFFVIVYATIGRILRSSAFVHFFGEIPESILRYLKSNMRNCSIYFAFFV